MRRSKGNSGSSGTNQRGSYGLLPWVLLGIVVLLIVFASYSQTEPFKLQTLSSTTQPRKGASGTQTTNAEAPVKVWTKEDVARIPENRVPWKGPCKDSCNEAKGFGKCQDGRCNCALGRGGEDCTFTISSLYGDHEVYEGMTLREVDNSGWDNGGPLYGKLVESLSPNTVVEVGVWKGASATKLATALRDQDSGILVAVDTWLPVLHFWQHHEAYGRMKDLVFQHGYPDIFHTFTGNMYQLNLSEVVIPFPATSRVASDYFESANIKSELIHIDAAHFYHDVVEDLELWWKHLREGGVMLGDDWIKSWPGVVKAVKEHAVRYDLTINVYSDKWWVQKPFTK